MDPASDTNPDDNADADPDGDGRSNAQEAADQTNPHDPLDQSVRLSVLRPLSKTKTEPADAPDEDKIEIAKGSNIEFKHP